MAFGKTGEYGLSLVGRELARDEITSDASNIGHPTEIIDQFKVMATALAYRLEMVCHAGRAIDDADVFSAAVLARSLIDDMSDFRKPGWLKPITQNWFKCCGEYERRISLQHFGGGKLY